jgi:hypothetical protein
MISYRLGSRAIFPFASREAGRNTVISAADRLTPSRRAILFLLISLGFPSLARPATLEDSAKELAGKIAAALSARASMSYEIRNASSLQPGNITRIEQALNAGLQERGVQLTTATPEFTVVVTLAENFKNFVMTAEIHKGETTQVVLVTAERSSENRAPSAAMPVTIHSEKFWEGPERILDAGEISNGAGKSWLVLLLSDGLRVQDQQSGAVVATAIKSLQSSSRDPWGNLNVQPAGNTIGVFLAPRMCTVNLETLDFSGCLSSSEGPSSSPSAGRVPVMFDLAPGGPPPPGKGTLIVMQPVCGGVSQFLATGARDYTQADSVQVFEAKSSDAPASTASAVSAELEFPGPVMALHAAPAAPRAVVRNLATGNYEAYRLSFSCGQ